MVYWILCSTYSAVGRAVSAVASLGSSAYKYGDSTNEVLPRILPLIRSRSSDPLGSREITQINATVAETEKKECSALLDGLVAVIEKNDKEKRISDIMVTSDKKTFAEVDKLQVKNNDSVTAKIEVSRTAVKNDTNFTSKTLVEGMLKDAPDFDPKMSSFCRLLVDVGIPSLARWIFGDSDSLLRIEWYQTKKQFLKSKDVIPVSKFVSSNPRLAKEFLQLATSHSELYSSFASQLSRQELLIAIARDVLSNKDLGYMDVAMIVKREIDQIYGERGISNSPDLNTIHAWFSQTLTTAQKKAFAAESIVRVLMGGFGSDSLLTGNLLTAFRTDYPCLSEDERQKIIQEEIQTNETLQAKLNRGIQQLLTERALDQTSVFKDELEEAYKKSCKTIGIKEKELALTPGLCEKLAQSIARAVYKNALKTADIKADEVVEAFRRSCDAVGVNVYDIDLFLNPNWRTTLDEAQSTAEVASSTDAVSIATPGGSVSSEVRSSAARMDEAAAAILLSTTSLERPHTPPVEPCREPTSPAVTAVTLDLPIEEKVQVVLAPLLGINDKENIFTNLISQIRPVEGEPDSFILPRGATVLSKVDSVEFGVKAPSGSPEDTLLNKMIPQEITVQFYSNGDIKCTIDVKTHSIDFKGQLKSYVFVGFGSWTVVPIGKWVICEESGTPAIRSILMPPEEMGMMTPNYIKKEMGTRIAQQNEKGGSLSLITIFEHMTPILQWEKGKKGEV